jgi:transcriptional regulator with XRE-family HTH domain
VPKSDNTAAGAFSQRLRELMRAHGHVSEGARSGVDVNALAEAAGTTYEMARRYAEGQAVPRPEKLQRIADWLGVPAAALAWGEGGATPEVNTEVLQLCIAAVMTAQAKTRVTLSTERVAALAAALYQESIDGRFPVPATVARMVRAMK